MRAFRWLCGVLVVGVVLAAAVAVVAYRPTVVEAQVGEAERSKPAGGAFTPGRVQLWIRLGLKDEQNTPWDGSIRVAPGRIAGLEFWRKGQPDEIDGSTWKLSSRPAPCFMGARRGQKVPVSETGLFVTLDGVAASAEVQVSTKQGDFSFKMNEVPLGRRLDRLEGAADVQRIPTSYQLTADATEEDYPAAAIAPDGTVHVAYVAFTHGPDFARRLVLPRDDTSQQPDLSKLDQPTGGDRIFLLRLRDGRWSEPVPMTPGGEDLYKTAIAIDGGGRPWVFYSKQVDGNFDLYATSLVGGKATPPVRLTDDPGPDLGPVAATDAKGNVWVAWQGFRGDNSSILAIRQRGDSFTDEISVADDAANAWDPAIAASGAGDVAIAWDTYARGNYDVKYRVAQGGDSFGPVVPVAVSLKQEAHAAAAYDPAGRLWIAWEEGPEDWGKDFGALVKGKGAPLYGGGRRTVGVKCFDGPVAHTAGDLSAALGEVIGAQGGQGRRPGQERRYRTGDPKSLPRLGVDAAGRVWLAYRAKQPQSWSQVGTTWFEYVTCYEGDRWLPPTFVHNSDNILDNRPALLGLNDGTVLLIGSCDGRHRVAGYRNAWNQQPPQGDKADPVNNDLFVGVIAAGTGADAPKLTVVPDAVPAEPKPSDEALDVARCQNYRMQIDGKNLHLMRGEFHRHTELSTDGGGDGTLIDMYRYAIDAVGFDWIGNGDHDNNNGREYPWWITQKTVDAYRVGEHFVPMFSYERSVSYPDGHRNPIFARRGIRTLPRFGRPGTGRDDQQPAHTPDTQLLYRYLHQYDGICASHTSATNMGTDWRDNDPVVEPVAEIYQGCRQVYEEPGALRAPSEDDAIGGWRPNGFIWRALAKGYRLGFQSSSDHISTHISYCNVWAEARTREAIFAAMKRRHVYGATDNIIADVRSGTHMMGDEFTTSDRPTLTIKLIGTAPFARIDIVKDNAYVYHATPAKREVELTWTDMAARPGTSYYYVRGEQEDGELVWVSPMWITYE